MDELVYMIIISGVLFGIPCALLASSKNKKVGQAFWLGVFFGIFALIYYIFCEKEDIEDNEMNYSYCGGCNAKVSSDSKFCPKCGAKFENETIKCKKYGSALIYRDIYVCDFCNREFNSKEKAKIHEQKCKEILNKKKNKWFCEKCGKGFETKEAAQVHEKKCKK